MFSIKKTFFCIHYVLYSLLATVCGRAYTINIICKILSEASVRILTNPILILAISFSLSSCNTFEGMGKDIKKGGKNIEDTANKHK